MQYSNSIIGVGKVIAVILVLMEFSWKNTRNILNPSTEKERLNCLPLVTQIIENTSAVSSFYVRVTESLPYSHIIYKK